MGTRRVCSKLAKLHSNFPLNTPSQSPIGLSCKRRRRERHDTLCGSVHLAETHLLEATSVFFGKCLLAGRLHRFTVAKNAAFIWSSVSLLFLPESCTFSTSLVLFEGSRIMCSSGYFETSATASATNWRRKGRGWMQREAEQWALLSCLLALCHTVGSYSA